MRTSPYATFSSNPVRGIFGILAWPRTYLNLAYLLIGFRSASCTSSST